MLAPSAHQAFSWAQGAALASSFLLATAVVGMKVVTRDHSAFTVLVYAAVLGFVFSTPPALFVWRWPTPVDLALLSLMGVLGVAMQACYIKGIEIGDAAAMAPIDYTRLVFAVALGFVLFHEIPHARTFMIGAAIVVASTLYITLREHRQTRRAQGLEAAQA